MSLPPNELTLDPDDVKFFLRYRADDFVIGIIPSSEAALDEFLQSLDVPQSKVASVPGHPGIRTFGIERVVEGANNSETQSAIFSAEHESRATKIGFIISNSVDTSIRDGTSALKSLENWLERSFDPNHASFDALFYLRSVLDVPGRASSLSPALYSERLLRLCGQRKKEVVNMIRVRLIITNFHEAETAKLSLFEQFWCYPMKFGSTVRPLYTKNKNHQREEAWFYVQGVVDDELLAVERNMSRDARAMEELISSMPAGSPLQSIWRSCKALVRLLRSHENSDGTFLLIQTAFRRLGEGMHSARLDFGKRFIRYFTDQVKRIMERSLSKAVLVYRICIVNLAGKPGFPVRLTDFYPNESDERKGKRIRGLIELPPS